MPYIKPEDRKKIDIYNDYYTDALSVNSIDTAGEIQYAIARIIKSYIERKGLNYQHCNDVMGALAGEQMEFYRRQVSPYEDTKIEINGDV